MLGHMRNIARRAPFIILSASLSVAAGCFGSSSKPLLIVARDASEPDAEIGTGVSDATTEAAADHAAPPPPAAGGTGAFGIVTVNGKQKMYLPESSAGSDGNAFLAVVNVGLTGNGVNGAPAQITTIDLGSPNYATATGGDSTVVIAVSTQYNTVYFIDPVTDTLTGTL